jgi:hypothetical protein
MSKMLGNSLPEGAYKALRSKIPTLIVATLSPNEYPNTTPVHFIWAKDRKTILMGMARGHQGVANIRDNGKVMVCMCEDGDVNVSIRGNGKVIKEHMECNEGMCVIQVNIVDIKDDSTHSETTSGIRYKCRTEKGEKFIANVLEELEKM